VDEKYGQKALDDSIKYYEVGSGLKFSRPKFVKMIGDILDGKFRGGKIVCCDHTRLARFAVDLISTIAKHGDCEIEYSHPIEAQDSNAELVNDVLSIVTVFTSRINGAKAAKLLKIELDPETIKQVMNWSKQGFLFRWMARECKRQGIMDITGKRELRDQVLRKALLDQKEVISLWDGRPMKGSFLDWFEQSVRKTGNPKNVVSNVRLAKAYEAWCEKEGHGTFSQKKMYEAMLSKGVEGRLNKNKSRIWKGISLLG